MRIALLFLGAVLGAVAAPDIGTVASDLAVPEVSVGEPTAGKRVRVVLAAYEGTAVNHLLYLPTDWQRGKRYPVIVEYPGNGPYSNKYGDVSTGYPDQCMLGYGVSGGTGAIWVCLPFVSADGKRIQRQWWGSIDKTVAYCLEAVREICRKYGGDPDRVVLAGFSRGAIAANYIGLHNDEIAKLWRGFICHSHYDGVRKWGYLGSDRAAAAKRLARLGQRPQWISHEGSVATTKSYLAQAKPDGNFTFAAIPFRNHTAAWVLKPLPQRQELRQWFRRTVGTE